MLDGVIRVIPNAKVGHIGMYRNEETFEPVNYFFKVPKDIDKREVIILDPMLATGGSAVDAIELLKSKGVKNIKFLCIIAAPEGLKVVNEKYPDIEIRFLQLNIHFITKRMGVVVEIWRRQIKDGLRLACCQGNNLAVLLQLQFQVRFQLISITGGRILIGADDNTLFQPV